MDNKIISEMQSEVKNGNALKKPLAFFRMLLVTLKNLDERLERLEKGA
ncbi:MULTISPECIES: hypothetical protein [Vibrio]|nr:MULTISPECIES: hypothetical protein [Vibrio]USD99051.1 hypothetical protein JKJ11_08610 [Vibrio sp. SCSIO 43133]